MHWHKAAFAASSFALSRRLRVCGQQGYTSSRNTSHEEDQSLSSVTIDKCDERAIGQVTVRCC